MTVSEFIRATLRTLGVLASGETPTADEEQDAFVTLNDMIDSWATERLMLFTTQRLEFTLAPGVSPHTLGLATGSPGQLYGARPIRIDRASIIPASATGSEYPLQLLSDAEWQATQAKTSTGTPTSLWVRTSYSTLGLFLHPIPNAADTLIVYTTQQLGRFTATDDEFDFPPGYARAVRYNLAKELAPEFGVSLAPEALAIADESKANLKRINYQPSYLRSDAAVLGAGGFNLISGD